MQDHAQINIYIYTPLPVFCVFGASLSELQCMYQKIYIMIMLYVSLIKNDIFVQYGNAFN